MEDIVISFGVLDPVKFLIVFGSAFIITFGSMPQFIKRLRREKILVRDYYKKGRVMVPTMGGLPMLAGILASLIFFQFIIKATDKLLVYYLIVFTYAAFGLTDDLLNVGRRLKIFVPFILALPIASLAVLDTSIDIGIFHYDLGPYFRYIIAPIYVMVVANLINMHSGFNGLAPGLSVILFLTVGLKALILSRRLDEISFILPVIGVLFAFFYYNLPPSRIFFGNSGSLMIGSALGASLLLFNIEIFGIIILTPHIVNFLLYFYWVISGRKITKWGRTRKDGTIRVPNRLTLKWIPPYYFKMKEAQCTYAMWGVTTFFCALGLIFL
ncbi:hypothetical protein ACFLRC_03515 [Candidatus Altiarchaeota archaeon]